MPNRAVNPSLRCAVPFTCIHLSVKLFTARRSVHRTSHRLSVVLHQSLFRSSNGMDQHVCPSPGVVFNKDILNQTKGCRCSPPSWAF